MSDHRELIEEARAKHQGISAPGREDRVLCDAGCGPWPCDAARLSSALEHAQKDLATACDGITTYRDALGASERHGFERAETAEHERDRALVQRDQAKRAEAELTETLTASEEWRKAYQQGKYVLYAMGGEIQQAAMQHLPCNESGLDSRFTRLLEMPRLKAKDEEIAALLAHQAATAEALVRAERERDTAKLWCKRTHVLPICGNTAPDERGEAIVQSMRAETGGSPEGGCGKPIEWLVAYRCLECGRWMHAECLRGHFVQHGDRVAAAQQQINIMRGQLASLARDLAAANTRVRLLLQDDANAYHRDHRGYVLSNCPNVTCQKYHAEISGLAAAIAAGEGAEP